MLYAILVVEDSRKRQLDKATAGLQGKHGARIVQVAKEFPKTVIPPHIASGFVEPDAMIGCKGIPLGHIPCCAREQWLTHGNYSGHSAFHHEDHKEITKCAKIAGFLPFFVIFAPSLRSLWTRTKG